MKCGVAEGWQYPSMRGNLLTARARWRYSLAQERGAHSDTTASVCTSPSLAVIYDASRAITLSLTLIQQFIYWCACIWAEVIFLWGGIQNITRTASIVSQETIHVTWFSEGTPDEPCILFFFTKYLCSQSDRTETCRAEQLSHFMCTPAQAGERVFDLWEKCNLPLHCFCFFIKSHVSDILQMRINRFFFPHVGQII